ncbi:regulator [Streptomyces sp. BH-SS-21]|uniref:Regulator n=1 Tax=Streptomyces liliiviolaceus TaxID=2823109 RepID=A0A940Y9C1_9ACTN|nr:regulator [Streptomyces liliiviolaceus]MBQ0855457.1 regulator [Streptomyces liliiviolaceus]
MNAALSPPRVQHACQSLSSVGLIRLVSEIDDHGPIPPRALARTLTGLSRTQAKQARKQADMLVLLDGSCSGLALTEAGADLASFYDAAARWARHHDYPHHTSTFSDRIRHVLTLLSEPAETQPQLKDGEAAGLHEVGLLLREWVDTYQRQHDQSMYGAAA